MESEPLAVFERRASGLGDSAAAPEPGQQPRNQHEHQNDRRGSHHPRDLCLGARLLGYRGARPARADREALDEPVRLWRQRRVEFLLAIAAFLGVALLGVLQGMAIAVALSILNVFRRAWWPCQTTLGRVSGLAGQHDRELHPEAEQLPGCVIFRFDAPLFFANARTFRDRVRRLAARETQPRWIVIAAEPITDVDTTGADMLRDLDAELNAERVGLVFAEVKRPVRASSSAMSWSGR